MWGQVLDGHHHLTSVMKAYMSILWVSIEEFYLIHQGLRLVSSDMPLEEAGTWCYELSRDGIANHRLPSKAE